MKKHIYLFSLLLLFQQARLQAQNAQAAAVIAGAGLATAIAAAVTIEQIKEQLELSATEYILTNEPQLTRFSIEVMELADGTRISDLSNTTCISFKVKTFDNALIVIDKSVLLMFTSRGWVNQGGLNTSYVKFSLLNSSSWNHLLLRYSSIATNIRLNFNNIEKVPCLNSISQNEFKENDSNYYKIVNGNGKTSYYKVAYLPMRKSSLNGANLEFDGLDDPKLPFVKMNGDSYLVGDYSDEFRLIYNEKTMGIYLIELNRLVQLKRATINSIHDFVNDRVRYMGE
ncbi:MAG: hypothetical protein V4590_14600 [Bacteroidota bacterium]